MNCPECDELKATYDKCLKDYVKKWDFSLTSVNGTNQCEKPFQVSCGRWFRAVVFSFVNITCSFNSQLHKYIYIYIYLY